MIFTWISLLSEIKWWGSWKIMKEGKIMKTKLLTKQKHFLSNNVNIEAQKT